MRQIKFRGRDIETGEYIYGDFIHRGPEAGRPGIIDNFDYYHEVEPQSVVQRIASDKNYNGIYDGDEIRIDFDGAAKVIGEGLLLSTLKTTKPTADAKLYVEYSHYRYRLIWRTHNGRVDTGVDMASLETILPYVEVAA